jgi:hypothetical protein
MDPDAAEWSDRVMVGGSRPDGGFHRQIRTKERIVDCESCGRHRPSSQVMPARSSTGAVLMVCGRCRRHVEHPAGPTAARHDRAAATETAVHA